MVTSLENPVAPSPAVEQHFTLRGLQWPQFKAIQASFETVPGVRLLYCEGVLEIVIVSKLHDAIRCLMGLLLGAYFEEANIEFFPSGIYNQIVEGIVDYQADLSYCFGTDKDVPDLCIEIVITSGSPITLQKYRLMGVAEVWFWEDGVLEVYHLREQDYKQISSSELLPELDLSLLKRCILFESPLEATKEFRKGISSND